MLSSVPSCSQFCKARGQQAARPGGGIRQERPWPSPRQYHHDRNQTEFLRTPRKLAIVERGDTLVQAA